MQHNLVAPLDLTHAGPGIEYRARTFVPEQMGEELVLALRTVDFSELRAAYATVVKLDKNLPYVKGTRKRDLLDDQRLL